MGSSQTQKNDETLTLAEGDQEKQNLTDSTNVTEIQNESAPKTLEFATELFDKGSKAIREEDYVEAVDCFSRALEIRAEKYGELAPECATTYYKYGCALLYKAQEEADPLGNVPKTPLANSEVDKSSKNLSAGEGSEASASDAKELSGKNDLSEKGSDEEDEGIELDDDDLAEESDLDFAWKMLDIARVIIEKDPEEKIEKVNVYSALGEVSLEREDFETSFNDYLKALSVCERLEEPDSRQVIELSFRVCLVLDVWGKVEESIPYCEKAISLCKSRLKRLSEDVNGNNSTMDGSNEKDKEVLNGILGDLEKKLEDLRQSVAAPRPELAEIMKVIAAKFAAKIDADPAVVDVSSSFDTPKLSDSSSSSSVTHLGVVGRGVKRATLQSIFEEPSSKKITDEAPK